MTYKVTDRRGQNREESRAVLPPVAKEVKKTLQQMIDECPLEPTIGRLIFIHDAPRGKVGTLYVPETAKRRGTTGIILKMNLTPDMPAPCHVGDRVLVGRYSGTLVEFENMPAWLILNESEILAVVTNQDVELSDQTVG